MLTLNEERRAEAHDRRVVVFADKAAVWEGRGAVYGAISR